MRDRTSSWQGKSFAAANATGVEPSETLVQPRAGEAPRTPRRAAPPADTGPIRVYKGGSSRAPEILLERYLLLERLGAGGFGVVWRAHDELLDREVAIKRIALPSQEDRGRAIREAHVTARLSHPAIVALYEASADDDAFYLISELVEGHTLAQLIASDELADEEVIEIGIALVRALEHAHARGVIHRDVKPQNVLIPNEPGAGVAGAGVSSEPAEPAPAKAPTKPAAAKLADFGGARMAGEDALTRTGDVLGTLAYMAPEQSEGHEAGTSADLYSLALVLYEALCGVNPVRGRTPAATARRIGEPIEPLERRRRDLPRELTRALDAALDPDPDARGTLADLHDALTEALEHGLARKRFARKVEHALAPSPRRRIALPRMLWLGCVIAAAIWEAAGGLPGVSLLILAAAAPLLVLPRRSGPGWLAAGLAPALGIAGLAAAFPALAGQRASWRARAGLAALGFWWLALAQPLLDRRLWLGAPVGTPARPVWEASLGGAATHVILATLTVELALGAAVWALAAVILPWLVRGRSVALDVAGAIAWTVALLAAVPLLGRGLIDHGAGDSTPHGLVLGATLGCVLAICARALRGPV